MARNFNGTSEYLRHDTTALSAVPISISCWFNVANTTANHCLVALRRAGQTGLFKMIAGGGIAGDPLRANQQQDDGTNDSADSTTAYTANTWNHGSVTFAATNDRRAYFNGGNKGTASTNLSNATIDAISIGVDLGPTSQQFCNGDIAEVAIWSSVLSDEEHAALAKGAHPFTIQPQNLFGYWPLIGGYSPENDRWGGRTMTLTGTPSVSAHPPKLYYPGRVIFGKSAAVAISGTLAATDAVDTAAIAGDVVVSGTLASTDVADSAAFGGDVIVSGTMPAVEAADTADFAGFPSYTGTLAATDAVDTAAFTGGPVISGTLAATETGVDTASFAGNVVVSATLAATETGVDTASFAGDVVVSGTLGATEGTDTASFAGDVVQDGVFAATDPADAAAFGGDVVVAGTLAATDAPDAAAIVGTTATTGTLASTDAPDASAVVGTVLVSGTLAATDAPDTSSVAGGVLAEGALAATEAADTCAMLGTVELFLSLAATEAPDVMAIVVVSPIEGVLAATDSPDTASILERDLSTTMWFTTMDRPMNKDVYEDLIGPTARLHDQFPWG